MNVFPPNSTIPYDQYADAMAEIERLREIGRAISDTINTSPLITQVGTIEAYNEVLRKIEDLAVSMYAPARGNPHAEA